MSWVGKIWLLFLGCVYAFLALALLVLFVPGLIALFVLLLSLCVLSPAFFKHVAVWSFDRALSTVSFLLSKSAEAFRNSENLT